MVEVDEIVSWLGFYVCYGWVMFMCLDDILCIYGVLEVLNFDDEGDFDGLFVIGILVMVMVFVFVGLLLGWILLYIDWGVVVDDVVLIVV